MDKHIEIPPSGVRGLSIICFGEMLWDILPTGKQPGGAPMNVAVHLKNLGHNPQMISRIGRDELGKELLDFVSEKGLSIDLIQQGETHLTGVVKANVSDKCWSQPASSGRSRRYLDDAYF